MRTRLTPKPANDVKVIRISSMAYEMVYVYAEARRMTLTDAVSLLAGVGLMHLYKLDEDGPQQPPKTKEQESAHALRKKLLLVLQEHAAQSAP